MTSAAPDLPPPADLIVARDPAVRVLAGGRTLVGGSPLRILTLTPEGATVVEGWRRPTPVGAGPARGRLARRLLDTGVLAPLPPPAPELLSEVTVVVPVRDRPAQLERCLAAVRAGAAASPLLVVDDGSRDPAAVAACCARHGAQVLRHDASTGAAAARNTGLRAASTPFVAFIDSDVVIPGAALGRLVGHFADPCLAVVAPRVCALIPPRGLIAGYESRHSALDMGATSGLVAPGRPIPWVPSTVLLVRRDAARGGFDPTLTIGEDVDLVWRLVVAGWSVRYDADVSVGHDHRIRLAAFVARRHLYARSVGMLARRHPAALPAMRAQPLLALPWLLLIAGHPTAAVAAASGAAVRTRRLLRRTPVSPAVAWTMTTRALLATGEGFAHAVRRAWSPPLLIAATRRPALRRIVLAAFATALVRDAAATRDLRTAAADMPVRLLDELVAAYGTWDGCIRERTVRPLLPAWRAPAPSRAA